MKPQGVPSAFLAIRLGPTVVDRGKPDVDSASLSSRHYSHTENHVDDRIYP